MFKNFKFKKILGITSLSFSAFAAGSSPAGAFGEIGADTNIIDMVIKGSPLVSAVLQAGILFGILYAIFSIGKDMLTDGGGGGKGPWGKLGAIVAFAILYYFLFMGS